jgi:hypothetical protein
MRLAPPSVYTSLEVTPGWLKIDFQKDATAKSKDEAGHFYVLAPATSISAGPPLTIALMRRTPADELSSF